MVQIDISGGECSSISLVCDDRFWPEGDGRLASAILSATDPYRPVVFLPRLAQQT